MDATVAFYTTVLSVHGDSVHDGPCSRLQLNEGMKHVETGKGMMLFEASFFLLLWHNQDGRFLKATVQ